MPTGTQGEPRAPGSIDATPIVLKAAGAQQDRLDWYTIELTEGQRSGIAVPILHR